MKWKLKTLKTNLLLPVWKQQTMLTFQIYEHATHFEAILAEANKKSRLKFVAQFENGKASVGLQFIPKDHPFITWKEKTISYCSLRTVMSINLY
jgi:homoserine dehydrogenase